MNVLPFSIVSIQGDMLKHVFEEAPKEACGLVVQGQYWPCKNIHPEPEKYFTICPKDYIKASNKGDIEAFFHSHTSGFNKFSTSDVATCKATNTPWVMYCTDTDDWHYADPTGNAPYIGRQWHYGIHDCYSLLKDFLFREFDIELDDFPRGEEQEWSSPAWDMFEQNFASQGFRQCTSSPQRGDMILMQLQAARPNHVGVMADEQTGVFYHHLLDRLSEANVYGGYWKKATCKILRHKELW
jgi:proteasome lid subunit RPN8/RPN11